MDIALGVSMAPASVRMVLVEGENADGVTVEEDRFEVAAGAVEPGVTDQVISAILGTREGAAEGGHQLTSTGVTWNDPADAAALRDALAAHKVNNVMLVSAFLAAAALAQAVGNAIDYERIGLLYVEPGSATLAVVDSEDGSVADVHRRVLQSSDTATELTEMIAVLDRLQARPQGLFVIGSGVDVAPIKPALEATTRLPVSVPEEPDLALARGAALASANAPLFASSTAALAYAQDPGTGELNPFAVAPGYFEVTGDYTGAARLAYSAVPDEDAEADTGLVPAAVGGGAPRRGRGPLLLVGSALAAIAAAGAVAMLITLAVNVRETVALQPNPGHPLVVPAQQAPAPRPAARVAPPHLPAVHPPVPAAPAPLPAPAVPVPAAPVPAPVPVHVRFPAIHLQAPVPRAHPPIPRAHPPVPRAHPLIPRAHPLIPRAHPLIPRAHPLIPRAHPLIPRAHPLIPRAHPLIPRAHLAAPRPPIHLARPAPPPVRATRAPTMRAPLLRRLLAPRPRAMRAPLIPRMRAPIMPRLPRMRAPLIPRMRVPIMPRFRFPMRGFRL